MQVTAPGTGLEAPPVPTLFLSNPQNSFPMKTLTSLVAAGALAFSLASCHSTNSDQGQAVVNQAQTTIDSLKLEVAKNRIVDSMQEVAKMEKEATTAKTANTSTRTRTRTIYRDRPTSNYTSASTSNAAYDPTPVAPAKRGWSAKAKGAVIGAGAGAVGGAIINKRNRGVGALIGGLGGAAVGTGVGAIIDRKNGR